MARFTAYVHTGMNGSRVEEPFEVPDDELEGLSDGERTDVIASYAQDAIANSYEWGWTEDES
ncbi:hypothetical protein Caci_2999 [Catenulispora acidiphila DSM 44928]|uniref:DUF7167 domain-containing protein n=1 Tax=Catenulispora acidiphila (strain DSM 44928 / JCM 14897 / NBRC 102108 / NRRL B-24433 / ID139908) TaxID=479433 RepID=C7Q316_CATAD|nr:hypothetical protein [Catenulispora acidiphila]ACU71908.1 hypothetical protein Caci_2999 [Catenulispora acidiphila DSM 44928]